MESQPDEPPATTPSVSTPPVSQPSGPEVPGPREELTPLVPSTPPAAVTARAGTSSPWPKRLGILLGVIAVLVVAGLGVGFLAYDRATAPNRSAPDVVVDNYLQAVLVDKSASEAVEYTCGDQSGLAQFKAFAKEIGSHSDLSVTWPGLDVRPSGENAATVAVTLMVEQSGSAAGEQNVPWSFTLKDDGGWRVCGASQTG